MEETGQAVAVAVGGLQWRLGHREDILSGL